MPWSGTKMVNFLVGWANGALDVRLRECGGLLALCKNFC